MGLTRAGGISIGALLLCCALGFYLCVQSANTPAPCACAPALSCCCKQIVDRKSCACEPVKACACDAEVLGKAPGELWFVRP